MADHFCLKWNNFQSSILTAFESLHNSEDLVDVTLMCEGRNVKAHKVILSACSPYFRNLFKEHTYQHPVIILKDVFHYDLLAILQFMYQGEVLITQDKLSSFLKTAELLQVSGLAGAVPPSTPQLPASPQPTLPSDSSSNTELTFTKHTKHIAEELQKEQNNKVDYDAKIEPLQSCSYTSPENLVIKMESDCGDFEIIDTDYGSSNHDTMDETSSIGEEQSILERSLKAQSENYYAHTLGHIMDKKHWVDFGHQHILQSIPRKNGKIVRKRCYFCYFKIRQTSSPTFAAKRTKQVAMECQPCKKAFCVDCFDEFHRK